MRAGRGSWEGSEELVRGRKGKPGGGGGGAQEAGGGDPRWRGPTDGAALTSMRLAGESPGTLPAARTSPAPRPCHWPAGLRPVPGLAGRRRVGARGGGGEACEQSVISGCSGRRRKRELGIAAPSPFPYFLSTGPRPRPAGEGPRAPPPTARQCAPGGARAGRCRLRRRPPLPPPPSRGSLRNRQQGPASFPPLAEAGAGSLRDEELPGRTRSPPIPGLRLGCGRWSWVPAEARPPPSRSPPPGSSPSLGRSAHSARGTSAHPRLPQARHPWLLLPAAWAPASRVSAGSQTCGAHSTGSRRGAPRFPPRHAAPASRGPDSPAQLSGSKAGPCPPA